MTHPKIEGEMPSHIDNWKEELRSLWQTTRENEGKYEKVLAFIESEKKRSYEQGIKEMKQDLKDILNRCKTERGVGISLGKYLKEKSLKDQDK
jgi:uridine kinase